LPRKPSWAPNVDDPSGRFNTRPAIAIMVSEELWNTDAPASPSDAMREVGADWLLSEEETGLGGAEAVDGSVGRGAEGWAAVVQWLGDETARGVIEFAVAYALTRVLGRLRETPDRHRGEGLVGFEVSRGTAAFLAAAHVNEEHGEEGPLEVEAVEEPSTIAGNDITELSYVGVEPWIVLLRNRRDRVRYVVVVTPRGVIEGALRVPFLPHEELFLRPTLFGSES
jgi:hypothetical protein